MANKYRGEVGFDAAGVQRVLRFSAEAIVNIEEAFDTNIKGLREMLADPEKVSMKAVRILFVIGVRDANPDLDEEAAGAIFKHLRPAVAMRLVGKAYELAWESEEEQSSAGNPQQPGGRQKNGTGPDSSTPGSNSASTKKDSGAAHQDKSAAQSRPEMIG